MGAGLGYISRLSIANFQLNPMSDLNIESPSKRHVLHVEFILLVVQRVSTTLEQLLFLKRRASYLCISVYFVISLEFKGFFFIISQEY